MCEVTARCPWVRMIQPSPSTDCTVIVRAEGDSSPVLLHTTECCSTCFPSWSSITHQTQCLRKASPGYGPLHCRTNIFPYSLMERDHAWSLEHSPWLSCGTTITLAFTHRFCWVTVLLSSWLQLSLGSQRLYSEVLCRSYTKILRSVLVTPLSISSGIWFCSQMHLSKNSETSSLENTVCKKYKK